MEENKQTALQAEEIVKKADGKGVKNWRYLIKIIMEKMKIKQKKQ